MSFLWNRSHFTLLYVKREFMSTHTVRDQENTIYFVTFTCHKWLPLFQMTNTYECFYKWFDYLNNNHCQLLGYVIMPNHFHGLIYFFNSKKNLNRIVGNGKRFLAYYIVDQLEEQAVHQSPLRETLIGQVAYDEVQSGIEVLSLLEKDVSANERLKNKKHQIFRPSFDAKECFNTEMVETKLDYIHHNPVSGRWNLVGDFIDYPFSSAAYYEFGKENRFVKHYQDFV